jgi:hypothetical protein
MMTSSQHVYEVRPRRDKNGVDLLSDALPFGRLWDGEPNAIANAIGYAKHRSRSHRAVICVYDDAGNVIATHEPARASSESGEQGETISRHAVKRDGRL